LVKEYRSILSLNVYAEKGGDSTLVDNAEFLIELVGEFIAGILGADSQDVIDIYCNYKVPFN
jgi:hypothetical protein